MAPATVYLPNGQSLTVTPVFGGLFFKSNDLNLNSSVFPAGWTTILQSEEYLQDHSRDGETKRSESDGEQRWHHHINRYRQPTLQSDNLFISSISNPSVNDFKPAASPTRQIAMMLWATLYWYFHQPEPPLYLDSEASKDTPIEGKPRGDWRINIKREGIFRGRSLLHKLERMGLISSEESSVGSRIDERGAEGWTEMFVSRRSFWQLSAKLFLFTLTPAAGPSFPGTPYGSRPSSPIHNSEPQQSPSPRRSDSISSGLWSPNTAGPFASGSHLPTYYPPPPLQYTSTNGVRHPIRPKPPRQGETFYARYIPSVGQYLSFRVASMSDKPVVYRGPMSPSSATSEAPKSPCTVGPDTNTTTISDIQLLHRWMNNPRVSKFWGCSGPVAVQEEFLKKNLEAKHSFPAIGCWDGKPFGYFEIYWVKEDILGRILNSNEVSDYDRGVHVLVGEEEYRGKYRLQCWISSLVHWAFTMDYRTSSLMLEPRIDNKRFIQHLSDAGFSNEKEVTFPHKQSALMRFKRESFDGPAL